MYHFTLECIIYQFLVFTLMSNIRAESYEDREKYDKKETPERILRDTFGSRQGNRPQNSRVLITIEETQFILYTRETQQGIRVIPENTESLNAANFDANKETVFATHGFQASGFQPGLVELREAYIKAEDLNFFLVDWSTCTNGTLVEYPVAVECCFVVGGFIAEFIRFLQANGVQLERVHVIGHSLGAHAVSQISNAGVHVARITGLDPTQVLFWGRPESERLDPNDAEFVDVIHTNIFAQGWNMLLGDSDFFPNGGDNQPSCGPLDVVCNHEEAFHYYAQTLSDEQLYPGKQCSTLREANSGRCNGPVGYMGVSSINSPRGIFYVDPKGKN